MSKKMTEAALIKMAKERDMFVYRSGDQDRSPQGYVVGPFDGICGVICFNDRSQMTVAEIYDLLDTFSAPNARKFAHAGNANGRK